MNILVSSRFATVSSDMKCLLPLGTYVKATPIFDPKTSIKFAMIKNNSAYNMYLPKCFNFARATIESLKNNCENEHPALENGLSHCGDIFI